MWSGSKDLLEGNPHLDHVYQRNFLKEGRLGSLRFLRGLARRGYDLSINTHPQSRIHYRATARIIGAPVRISHVYECFGLVDRLLVNRTLAQDYQRHTVENNFDILRLLGKKPVLPKHALEIYLSAADHAWAAQFLAERQLAGRPRLGLHAGSGGTKNLPLKRWPLEQYIELLKQLQRSCPELDILLFGGPEEEPELRQLMAEVDSPRLIRAVTPGVRQAGALMQRCDVFLSVDTALMHVAAAVRVRRHIVIEAFTLNKTNEPYGNPFILVPNPAVAGRNLEYYRYDGGTIKGTREELIRAMKSVTVDAVHEAVVGALSDWKP
jgi:heptosyltransferase-2